MFADCNGCAANTDAEHHVVYMLGLPCRPCSGPWKLKFGDYYLVLTILGVLGMVRKHLRLRPTFFYADFCSGSVWELSWGAKSLLTASAESAGNPLNYSLTSKYEFVLWPHRISIRDVFFCTELDTQPQTTTRPATPSSP